MAAVCVCVTEAAIVPTVQDRQKTLTSSSWQLSGQSTNSSISSDCLLFISFHSIKQRFVVILYLLGTLFWYKSQLCYFLNQLFVLPNCIIPLLM